jgi:hypothetical protein
MQELEPVREWCASTRGGATRSPRLETLSRRCGLARTAGSIFHGDVSGACWPKCVAKGRRRRSSCRFGATKPSTPSFWSWPTTSSTTRRSSICSYRETLGFPERWARRAGEFWWRTSCRAHLGRTASRRPAGLGRYHFGCTRSAGDCEASAVYTDGGPRSALKGAIERECVLDTIGIGNSTRRRRRTVNEDGVVWRIRRRDAVSVTAKEAHTTQCLPTPPLASTPVEHPRLRASPETGIRSVYDVNTLI